VQRDHRQFDVVVGIAAKRVVRVVAKGADRWRETWNEATEDAAFQCCGIADLGLIHAVLPNEIIRDFVRRSDFEEITKPDPEVEFLDIEPQRFGARAQ
jgi:hypothetical protein